MMHVVFLNYLFPPACRDHEELFAHFRTIPEWCTALRQAGVERVSVVQGFCRDLSYHRNGVDYVLVHERVPSLGRIVVPPLRVHRQVVALQPDVVHHNGLPFYMPSLRRTLSATTAIVWQHHGGGFPRPSLRWLHRHGFTAVDGCFFSSRLQADPWVVQGMLSARHRILEIPEASTTFSVRDRVECRRSLQWHGSPVLLWVGHLNANKDPLTVLKGFAACANDLPEAMLYMAYRTSELLEKVRSMISTCGLTGRVVLLGPLSRKTLEEAYSAADFFVLGSHHEGSGFALIEAESCGAVPIVTDIPSFRSLTGEGSVGYLWTPGDHASFSAGLLTAVRQSSGRANVLDHFAARLSYASIGRAAAAAYRQVHSMRTAS
jgi:glycosyltransferase involved in cell wall biosynthesis